MENPKISVIMATFNCEKTVEKAIDSILAQTYTNWVMIVCDDGSTDGTLNILNRYAAQHPGKFVVICNDRNRKLPYSLNHCLQYVQTELVARMDGDDWSVPDRFEKQVAFLREHPEYDLVGTGVAVFDGDKRVAAIIKTPIPTKRTMLKENAFSHASILTYKRVFDALGGYSLDPIAERVEDVDLWCRFLAADFKGYNLSDELYVIPEDDHVFRRRTFKARLNSARTRSRGYRLMGYKGLVCYKPYLYTVKAFVPTCIYKKIHNSKLAKRKQLQVSE